MTDNGSGGGVTMGKDSFVEESPCNFNCGMRGIKVSPYEGGHRVPFILDYPRLQQGRGGGGGGGRDVDTLTSYVDFMPTILELCGAENAFFESFYTENKRSIYQDRLRLGTNTGNVEKKGGVLVSAGVSEAPPRPFHGRSLVPFLQGGAPEAEAEPDFAMRCMVTDTQRVPRPVKWRNSCIMRGKETPLLRHFHIKTDAFTKTGSGQTYGKHSQKSGVSSFLREASDD